ncbi:NUDIX domain-containing protein [Patescibacteria group bacterium]|nr:NUDIX domain-containing protein [Patescibacteria group bacterium]
MSPKHQLTENVKLLQKAAIIRQLNSNPEVLLLKRSSDSKSRPNCWDLPGGNSEWPDTIQSSKANLHLNDITREITEETGLVVAEKSFSLDKLSHLSTYFDVNKQVYTMICGWLVDFLSTDQKEIQTSDEHQEYAWVSEAELSNYDFGGESGTFVLDIIKKSFAKL